jgi:NADPH:quinone reductase
MRAIVLDHFGGLDSLVIKEIPEPEPEPGKVVIQVKAFGINHAEMHMRRGEWAEAAPVSGIECVGIVKSCPSGESLLGRFSVLIQSTALNIRIAPDSRTP